MWPHSWRDEQKTQLFVLFSYTRVDHGHGHRIEWSSTLFLEKPPVQLVQASPGSGAIFAVFPRIDIDWRRNLIKEWWYAGRSNYVWLTHSLKHTYIFSHADMKKLGSSSKGLLYSCIHENSRIFYKPFYFMCAHYEARIWLDQGQKK